MIAQYTQSGDVNDVMSLFHDILFGRCDAYIVDHYKCALDMCAVSSTANIIEITRQLFNKLSDRNVVLWSVMIFVYGMHGYAMKGL
jgi:hypothetical protein